MLKTNQEPSIACAQEAIQELNAEIVPINNPVGESACNGRVENTVRRIQEKMGVLKHELEKGIGHTIPEQSIVVAWMAKWAAELISKYSPGDDGRTPYERIRREECQVPLVPFGKMVKYLPMRTVKKTKGTPTRKPNICLGIVERTEETTIGTPNGVIKCKTVNRMAKGDQWNRELVLGMRGTPWEPMPGKQGMHIPIDVEDNGEYPEGESNQEARPTDALDDEIPVGTRSSADKLLISRKAITRYGATAGCRDATNWSGKAIHQVRLLTSTLTNAEAESSNL